MANAISGIDPGTVALVVAILAFLGTVVNPWLAARAQRAEKVVEADLAEKAKKADWARQDEVAKRVEAAAVEIKERGELLIASNAEKERMAAERDTHLLGELSKLDAKADTIHTLVNSEMTAARQELLDGKRLMLVALKKVIVTNRTNGVEPTPEDEKEIEETESSILKLERILADRLVQQRKADADAKAAKAKADTGERRVGADDRRVGAYDDAEKDRRGA